MLIVVNTRYLRKNKMDGIGYFTYNTLKYIVTNNPQIEFHFLFDSPIDKEFIFADNVKPYLLFPPAKHAVLNILWFEWSVRRYLKRVNPDLFLSPEGILCLGWKGKQFCVMHDINFVHIPKDLKWTNRTYNNAFFPRCAKKAAHMATLSEYSKADIVSSFGVNAGKIDVVYCGINSFYEPLAEDEKQRVKATYTDGKDYFFFVGTLMPRKNVLRLMQAFELFKKATGSDMKLMLTGGTSYKTQELFSYKEQSAVGSDIIFTGRLNNDELKKVFGAAFCLTFVPYFEGFGIPIIEAMQCDVPVITSNVTSMPEVAGDAAIMVDPYKINEIAAAMQLLFSNASLRKQLIEKGRVQKLQFSWDRTSRLMWDSIKKIL
jgi:glycosyltransferase involved in cell wall biosynthesis